MPESSIRNADSAGYIKTPNNNLTMVIVSVLFVILFCSSRVIGEQGTDPDMLIEKWKNLSEKEAYSVEEQLMGLLYSLPYETADALSKKLLLVSRHSSNKSLYIKTLTHSWRFNTFTKAIANLTEAARIASEEKNMYLLGGAYLFKSMVFRDNALPDSAMANALIAKELFEKPGYKSELEAVLIMIAEMHFYAGENSDAEENYRMLLANEPKDSAAWRYLTVRNNIGLIKIREKKYDEAESYFLESYAKLSRRRMDLVDSVGLAYIYRKLMEIQILKKDFFQAEYYYRNGRTIAERYHSDGELPGYLIGYGEILLHKGERDSALILFKKAEQMESERPDLKYRVELYSGLASVYRMKGDYRNATLYFEKLAQAHRTADSVYNRARILHIYAQHKFQNSTSLAENNLREKNLVLFILLLTAASLSVFIYIYYRLRKSYRILIEKNLELAHTDSSVPLAVPYDEEMASSLADPVSDNAAEQPEPESKEKPIDDELLEKIIQKTDYLLQNQKVYMQPGLTAERLAELAETNRTYLSRAIKVKYGISFLELINGYRVKEAIIIISSPESKNLSIDGIAQKSGFNNRVTFSKVFQHHTGVSPSYFIKNMPAAS